MIIARKGIGENDYHLEININIARMEFNMKDSSRIIIMMHMYTITLNVDFLRKALPLPHLKYIKMKGYKECSQIK